MPSSYQIPAYGTTGEKLLGWLTEAVAEGDIWLKAQQPTTEWDSVMSVLGPLYGTGGDNIAGRSNTGYNKVRSLYKELRASLSNFSHAGEFVPTEADSQEFYDRAHMLTNLDVHWERVRFIRNVHRDVLGYALAKGTGYWYEDWDPSAWGPGRGDIRLRAVDPQDVTFIQLPKDHSIQNAYVVLIREEIPLQLAKRMYYGLNPHFADGLVADNESPGWIQKGINRVQQFLSPALRAGGSIRKANDSFPTTYVWTAYVNDGAINETGHEVTMGAPQTNWSYKVPFLGQDLPQPLINPNTGQRFTLPAKADDCLLFPLRRKLIFARTGICYDGSSPWWHGEVPLARLRFNDLPWEALGASQIGDAITMQGGLVRLMRIIEDSAAARLNPPRVISDQLDKAAAEAFDTTKAGALLQWDLTQGSPIEFPVPPQTYDVPPWIGGPDGFIRQQEDRMESITAARDLTAIAKARQIPSADTVEKMLEMAGPIVQDMVNAIVEPLTRLGTWRLAYYFQFYTRARMIRISDPNAVEMIQNIKYTPEKITPAIPGESLEAEGQRKKNALGDFRYEVTESGVSEINRMSRLLLYIQLAKSGVLPLSWWTMAKAAKVPNYGPPPAGTNTEMERVQAQERIVMERAAENAVIAAEAQMAMGGGMPPPEGGAPPPGQGKPNGASGENAGRPPSFKKPPHLVNKPNEGRSTISTS